MFCVTRLMNNLQYNSRSVDILEEALLSNINKTSNSYMGALEDVGNSTLERWVYKSLKCNCNEVEVVCSVYVFVLMTPTLVVSPV